MNPIVWMGMPRNNRGWWGDGDDNDWKTRNQQSVKEELESDNASHHRRRKTKLSKVGDASSASSTLPSDRILNIILETGCQRTKWRNEGQNWKCVLGILLHEGNTILWHIKDSIKCVQVFPIPNHWIFYQWCQIFVAGGGGGGDGSDGGYGDDMGCRIHASPWAWFAGSEQPCRLQDQKYLFFPLSFFFEIQYPILGKATTLLIVFILNGGSSINKL